MNIGFISVAPPYRGGISKHTSILVQKLKIHHSVYVINYSRQYPSFIFPGKTQYVEPSSNDENDRCIDSINPITWLRTGNKLAKKKYDLIIFRYWNPFFAPSLGFIANIVKKKSSNTKLVSLCDNILPHEKFPFGVYFTKKLFNNLDGHLLQSSQTELELKKIPFLSGDTSFAQLIRTYIVGGFNLVFGLAKREEVTEPLLPLSDLLLAPLAQHSECGHSACRVAAMQTTEIGESPRASARE